MDQLDSGSRDEPPQRGMASRSVASGDVPNPNSQRDKNQPEAHDPCLGEKMQGKVMGRRPYLTDSGERWLQALHERSAGEFAHAYAQKRSRAEHAPGDAVDLPSRIGLCGQGAEPADRVLVRPNHVERLVEPRDAPGRTQ